MSTPTVRLEPNKPGTLTARWVTTLAQGGSTLDAIEIAERTPRLKTTPELLHALRTRGAVPSAGTSAPGWGTDLAPETVGRDFVAAILGGGDVFAAIATGGQRFDFRARYPRDTGTGDTGAAGWPGEGQPRAVLSAVLDTLTLLPYTASSLCVLSNETIKFGAISEEAVRRLLVTRHQKFLGAQLLDPSVAASSARPASLTNGGAVVTTTGTTAAAIVTDLESLVGSIQSAMTKPRFFMRPQTYFRVLAKLAGAGCPQPPGLLLNIPVIASAASPQQITLIDLDTIAVGFDDVAAVEVESQASIEMSTTPTQNGLSGTGAQMVSLFQSGLTAVRVQQAVSWASIYAGIGSPSLNAGVAYMTVAY